MRNLKKILALVLALMMVLSVMVTASAATFADDGDIEHKEAVEVLTAAGVIRGVGNDSFDPDGILNRAQAATIIAYILEGSLDNISNLVDAVENPFTDVPAWAEPYVLYAYSQGVVVGTSATTYSATKNLTGYEFGKMLLITIGLCESADFTPDGWKLTVATELKDHKLLTGLSDVKLSAPLSREHACQMAFNAMKYTESGEVIGYYVERLDTVFATYLEAYLMAKEVAEDDESVAGLITEATDTSDCLLTNSFGIYAGIPGTDAYGRPEAKVWVTKDEKGNEVDVYVEMKTATAKYTSAVSNDVIKADLNIKTLNENVTGNGKVVEYYKNTDGTYTRVVISYTAAQVTVSQPDAAGNVTYTLNGTKYYDYSDAYLALEANKNKADTVALNGDIVNGTMVTYNVVGGVAQVYPTTTVEGALNGKNATAGTLTIGADKYAVSAAANSTAVSGYSFAATAQKFAVDQYGFIVGLATSADAAPVYSTDYVYVLGIQAQGYVAASGGDLINAGTNGKAAVAKAMVLTADGTYGVIDLKVTATTANNVTTYSYDKPAAGGTITKNSSLMGSENDVALAKGAINAWFAYTVNEDGSYTLEELGGVATVVTGDGSVDFAGSTIVGRTLGNANYITSATKVTALKIVNNQVVKTDLTGNKTYSTGALTRGNVLYTVNPVNNTVAEIVIYGFAPEAVAPAADYVYIVAAGDQVAANVYEYSVYMNGALTTIYASNSGLTKGSLLTVAGLSDGVYTLNSVSGLTNAAKVTIADATYFVAGNMYTYAKTCQVYDITTGANGVAASVEAGDYVQVLVVDGAAVLVYIVDEPQV